MTCAACEALKEDLHAARAELDQVLADGREADRLARWMRAFSCSMKQARLLMAFVDQPQRAMTRERILNLTIEDPVEDDRMDRSADSRIKHLRRVIAARTPAPVIATLYGLGYGLTEGGAEALRRVAGEIGA